jgi:fido (protein-threonine AMPylation protein)
MSKYSGDDHYVDPESGVLKNLFGISREEELGEKEAEHVATRSYELSLSPLSGTVDLAHLQALHHYLFRDVYAWAGKIRDVDIAKGNSRFANHVHIVEAAIALFAQLSMERYLADLGPDQFSTRAAHYLGELNALHPFRDGNGRVLREFIGQLALLNGYEIAWENTSREETLEAAIASFRGDESKLASIIRTNLEPADRD